MFKFDPSIIDQEKVRKLKRKRLFRIFMLPIILLFVIGAFLLRTGFFNLAYHAEYNAQNYSLARSYTNIQEFANIISSYVIFFDRGDALFKSGDYTGAENAFRMSLKENPPNTELCKVYVNLSLSIEKQGDEKSRNDNYDDAMILYSSAESILYSNNCASKFSSGNGSNDRAEVAKKRIIEKRRNLILKNNNINDNADSGDYNDDASGISDIIHSLQGQDQSKMLYDIRNKIDGSSQTDNQIRNNSPTW